MKKCPYCAELIQDDANVCRYCGRNLRTPPSYHDYRQPYIDDNNPFSPSGPQGKCRGIAALFAILLGSIGVQYFYIGKVGAGFLTILLSLVTFGIWPVVMLIQGILMFGMSNADFQRKYVDNPALMPMF